MRTLAFTILFFAMFAVIATAKPKVQPTPQIIYSAEMKQKIDAWHAKAKMEEEKAREMPVMVNRILLVIIAFVFFVLAFIFKVSLASFIYRVISGSYANSRRRKQAAKRLAKQRKQSQSFGFIR